MIALQSKLYFCMNWVILILFLRIDWFSLRFLNKITNKIIVFLCPEKCLIPPKIVILPSWKQLYFIGNIFIAQLNCFITLTCNCFTDHLRLVWKLKSKLLNKRTKFFKKSKCQENIRDSTEFLFVWLMRKMIFIENFFNKSFYIDL